MSSPPPNPRLLAANAVVLVLASAVIGFVSASSAGECGAKNCCDPVLFSGIGHRLISGGDPYAPMALPGGIDLPFLYPPWAVPAFLVWSIAPALPTHVVYAALSTTLLLWAVWRVRGIGASLAVGFGGWTVLSAFLAQTGAIAGACATLLLDGSVLLRTLALALLLFKPTLGIPAALALLLLGRVREVVGAGVGVLASAALATALWGTRLWSDWLAALQRPYPELDRSLMANWYALAPASVDSATPVVWLAGLGVIAWAARKLPPMHALGVAFALAPVCSPHAHPYDLAVWAVPALALEAVTVPVALSLGILVQLCVWFAWRAPLPMAGLVLAVAVARDGLRRPQTQD